MGIAILLMLSMLREFLCNWCRSHVAALLSLVVSVPPATTPRSGAGQGYIGPNGPLDTSTGYGRRASKGMNSNAAPYTMAPLSGCDTSSC